MLYHATASRFDDFLQIFLHVAVANFPGLVSRAVPVAAPSDEDSSDSTTATYACYRFLSQVLVCVIHEAGAMAPDQGASLMLVATVKEKFRFGDEEEEEEGGSVLGPHKSNTKPTLASLVSLWTPLLVERLEGEVSAENSDADDEMLSSLAIDLLELLLIDVTHAHV